MTVPLGALCFTLRPHATGPVFKLEAQEIARRSLLAGLGVDDPHALDQATRFKFIEMPVQRGTPDFTIMGKPVLGGETAKVRIEPITKMPKHDFGRGFQPALLDGPVGGGMAHGAPLSCKRASISDVEGSGVPITRVVNP